MYVGQKYLPKNKYFFAILNNVRGLSLVDKTKDYADRNTGGQVNSLHEVTQLGFGGERGLVVRALHL